ncbi:hypothetical protein [Rhizobium mesoamericanum]|uniref:hypothetical protein n=1 Tax=Rhizobium mesoamericanum TaxID=1079800 RepID=UPI0003FA48AA|nr:hypothetical protein [Rhizobium mesoamericanum]
MATSDIANANTRLIGFSQYRQLRFLRPPPPTLNAGNDLHASHTNLSDLILVSALMLVLMPEHRLTGSFSKIRSPDAHISTAASTATRVESSVSLSEPDAAWVAERQSVITANLARKARQDSELGRDTEDREKDGQANRHLDLHPSDGNPHDDELAEERLSGESERIGSGNLDEEVPFGEHEGYV